MRRIAGYSKESQKIVQLYRTKDRYEPSAECEALVNAKYQSVYTAIFAGSSAINHISVKDVAPIVK